MNKRRVVVTGVGAITPFGIGARSLFHGIISSKSAISKIESFDTESLSCKIAGNINENFDHIISPHEQRKMDRFIHFALIAAEEAIKDSGFVPKDDFEKERAGVIIGSGIGGLKYIHDTATFLNSSKKITPYFIPASLINLASGYVSIKHSLKGPNHSVVTACASGTHAIGDAFRIIQYGDADLMVAGGAEAAVCKLGMAGFCAAKTLSTNFNDTPELSSRPWDKRRDGFVMGEGSGILVLEELSRAKKRGAKIYAEVIGYGMSGDAYHITSTSGDGAFRAMRNAINNSSINLDQIDYINAHGTSTPVGDIPEFNAVKTLFKDSLHKLSMSSTKSSIGHLLGAAGSVEAIISIMAMNDNVLPPTLNLEDPDDDCFDKDSNKYYIDLVPNKAKEKKLDYIMSNSFGFGGTNASIVFSKYN